MDNFFGRDFSLMDCSGVGNLLNLCLLNTLLSFAAVPQYASALEHENQQ